MSFFSAKTFRLTLVFIFFGEILSFLGYFYPIVREISFFIIIFLAFIVSLLRLEYGLAIIFTELFIGSKGYLFYFSANDLVISIRIALWLVVLAVWLAGFLIKILRKQEINFIHSRILFYFSVLFAFLFWGLINGFLNQHQFNNLFFDFNGWLYLLLLFPLLDLAYEKREKIFSLLFSVLAAAIIWLTVKTLFLLFIFSHNLTNLASPLYRWVRTSGVGEITQMPANFYRIFFQSHIFFIPALFLVLFCLSTKISLRKRAIFFFILSFILAIIFISLSRSNWVGLAAGWLVYNLYLVYNRSWRQIWQNNLSLISASFLALIFIFAVVKFPLLSPKADFSPTLISKRASQVTNEAGVSSRWALLPNLWTEIKKAPVLGQGFGTTITYYSRDPRVLNEHPDGHYTTYAFEWGWLGIWLKLGVFGLISYLFLLVVIIWQTFKLLRVDPGKKIVLGVSLGLVSIAVVNFFSPYLNHPLGIGYLLITAVFVDTDLHSWIAKSKLKPSQ